MSTPSSPPPLPPKTPTAIPLPCVAIFGHGWGSRAVAPAVRAAGFKLVAVWARTLDEAEIAAKETEAPFFTASIKELLARPEVGFVVIATPPHTTAEIAIKALQAGKHILAEVPAALSTQRVHRMLDCAQRFPTVMNMVGFQLRYLPAVEKMRELVKEKLCGEVMTVTAKVSRPSLLGNDYDWRADRAFGGGVTSIVGSHIIDLLSYVTGTCAQSVTGTMRTYREHTGTIQGFRRITADDFCEVQLQMPGTLHASFTITTHAHTAAVEEVTVNGSEGTLVLRNGALLWVPAEQYGSGEETVVVEAHERFKGKPLEAMYEYALEKMYMGIAKAIRENELAHLDCASLMDGLYVQSAVDAVFKSSTSRTWVELFLTNSRANSQQPLLWKKMSLEKK